MADYSPNAYNMLSSTDIVKIDTDTLIRAWAWDEYPLAAFVEHTDAHGTDSLHYWMNNVEGYNKTALNMSAAMTGGDTSEAITVDSTAGFVVGHVIRFQENTGSTYGQDAYISVITSTTVMTVNTFSGNLDSHADNTVISLSGDRVLYGDTINQKFRLPTRDTNTIEQVEVVSQLPYNMLDTELTNGQSVESYLIEDAMSQFKQKLTGRLLVGTERVAADSAGYGGMAGLLNLVDSDNIGSGTYDKATFRSWLSSLKKRGAFPGQVATLFCNESAINTMYSFDDSNVGISWRDTDKFIGTIRIRGIACTVVLEPMMNEVFNSGKARIFALTPKVKNKPTFRLAIKARARAKGRPRRVLETEASHSLQVVRYCTAELRDPFRHGFYMGD